MHQSRKPEAAPRTIGWDDTTGSIAGLIVENIACLRQKGVL
jgi:hypothetical protein